MPGGAAEPRRGIVQGPPRGGPKPERLKEAPGGPGRGEQKNGGEEGRRRRIHQLEKEKLQLETTHNQQLCALQAELTCLRSTVERGEAQRAELQYQLAACQRDLAQETHTLRERVVSLQQVVVELQKVVEISVQAKEEAQQEVEERDHLIRTCSSDNERLHRLLQEQEDALEEAKVRMEEVQKESERGSRRHEEELKNLREEEETTRREKEECEQKLKALESQMEEERAAHLEVEVRSDVLQAALAVARSDQQGALCSLEALRTGFGEAERLHALERHRSARSERALQRLQESHDRLAVAVETERNAAAGLEARLEEETGRHTHTHTLLEQANQRRSECEEEFANFINEIRDTLQRHCDAGSSPPARDDGEASPASEVRRLLQTTLGKLDQTGKQVEDLLQASERLLEENQTLRQLTSDQTWSLEEAQRAREGLQDELGHLRQEASHQVEHNKRLQEEMEEEKKRRREEEEKKMEEEEKRRREEEEKKMEEEEKRREEEEKRREEERKKMEEMEKQRSADVQKMTDLQEESKSRLCFLHGVYQRLVSGSVLLQQPQVLLDAFTWEELCEVISEQVDRLTSDLQDANRKVSQLQAVCVRRKVCVQQGALRRRLQSSASQCSSLQARVVSLTSDLCRLRSSLSSSRRECGSFLSACALLAAAASESRRRLRSLCQQKALLSGRLAAREELEAGVRRLAAALQESEEEEEAARGRRRRRAAARWRSAAFVAVALRRWRAAAAETTVMFRLERGGGAPAVFVGREVAAATREGAGDDGGGWLRSRRLAHTLSACMDDLQGVLELPGSAPQDVMSAARSGLSRLLDHLLGQSDASWCESGEGKAKLPPPPSDTKSLVSCLQQHFLLFSQRLHSAEVERRSLRQEVANQRRAGRRERDKKTFHSVYSELRQALGREQEVQLLLQEQSSQLQALQLQAHTHSAQQADTHRKLSQTTQCLSEVRQQLQQKQRWLVLLGKHLLKVQRRQRPLVDGLRRAQEQLREADRRREGLIRYMEEAERSYLELQECLVQSPRSLSERPRPPPSPRQHLQPGAEELTACQSLLSSVWLLYQTCTCSIDRLQQEVSALRRHVTALRGELRDARLRDDRDADPARPPPFSNPDV